MIVAVALPGYLLIDNLFKSVKFDSKTEDASNIQSGGTATIKRGILLTKRLISKHNIIDVAVKFINGDRITSPDIFDSFKYEISIMSSLPPSPFLVELIGYSIEPMAIVMKSYAMSLQDVLNRSDFMTNDSIKLKAAKEIALGMQIVHSKDIIHFDLKPGK